ncbi:helix-turn-helix domain-containing protein [Amycolatopsis samaneae]|uniref:Transcriptional regulator n=1 Tax=Amycolatopsis samaneae TaxID=664691 RepID=A0ABW5GUU1_9PSEU
MPTISPTNPPRVLPTITRLHVLCLLSQHEWRRHQYLCQATGSTKDQFRRHLDVLLSGGYVTASRGRGRACLLRLTPFGAQQRDRYLAMLGALFHHAAQQTAVARVARPDWFVTVDDPTDPLPKAKP